MASRPDANELVVLSVLADGPRYGYAISKCVAAASEGGLRLTPGMLYPLLSKLETSGLITSEWEEVKSDRAEEGAAGRRRKWYRLSAKGRKHLTAAVRAQRDYLSMIEGFLSREGGGGAS